MSGSKGPAEAGQLIFLAGGDRALFERAQPALDVMGKAAFFLGPARGPLPVALGPSLGCAWVCEVSQGFVEGRGRPHHVAMCQAHAEVPCKGHARLSRKQP